MTDITDDFSLRDHVALVTGGGRGIGAATAIAFAEAGADVTVVARTREQLDATATAIRDTGHRAHVGVADVDDLAQLEAVVSDTVAELGRLDVVVNVVGGTIPAPFTATSAAALEKAFHFNVVTAFELCRLAVPHMLDSGGGSIVNITSAMGRLTDRGYVAYGTVKAALAHMTRLMAADLAPRIRVNAIAPGSIATESLDGVLTDELRAEMIRRTPLRRLGLPREIALAALYLVSPAGAFVTGKVLEVDGGIETPNLNLGLPDL
jgi:7-alpha-hydroxysteroid dehydrogenase